MTAQLHDTNVCMDGLLDVLGKNLYSTPEVAIRELVQNAHDACIRRKLEQSGEFGGEIRLIPDSQNHTLTITDTGSGLTYDEVIEYLATVGSGYTRVLRNDSQTDEMIGYFGLGFLSAYVVSDKVDVWTTSYQTPDKCWHFSSRGGKRFAIQAANNHQQGQAVGTTVCLQLTEDFTQLASAAVLTSLLAKYCCLLPVSIYVGDADKPVNDLAVPWLQGDVPAVRLKKEQMAFARLFENLFDPICTIAIPPDNPAGVQGLIWLQDATGYATSDYRNASIFVRNMFITAKKRELLPQWAGFAGCVIESEQLIPTASREDIQDDEQFALVQAVVAEALVEGLKSIAQNEPETWRRILVRHNQALLGAALNDNDLFDMLAQQLKVPTNLGEMTLPNVLKQSENRIYVRQEDKNSYEDILLRAKMTPVVSGYLFAASAFCRKYAEINHCKLVSLGDKTADEQLLGQIQLDQGKAAFLTGLFKRSGDAVLFTRVQPDYLPMVIVEDQQVLLKQRIEQDENDKRIGAAALMLARMHTNKIDDSIKRRVYINLGCPLVGKLFEWQDRPDRAKQLATMMRNFMVIMCHDAHDKQTLFADELQSFGDSIMALISA